MECQLELNGKSLNSLENLCFTRTLCIVGRMLERRLFLVMSVIRRIATLHKKKKKKKTRSFRGKREKCI